jgi:uncharacterized protein (TIGR03083 family)
MKPEVHRQWLIEAIERCARVLSADHLDRAVSGCPGWSVADLARHLITVEQLFIWVLEGQRTSRDGFQPPSWSEHDELGALFGRSASALLAELDRADVDAPAWIPNRVSDVAGVFRRMAHEHAVHAWDAEAAIGEPTPLSSELATDGIDEWLHLFSARRGDLGGSVHLHCTDIDGEWVLEGGVVTREHRKCDCALRGPAESLLLALWQRVPADQVDIVGDGAVAMRFLGALS